MKTLEMNQIGFTEKGIETFLNTIESVLPNAPGNWNFIDFESKLNFVTKNKETIESYLQGAKPKFSDEESEAFNWFNNTDELKIKRLNEVQAAIQAIRMF
jgi:hypothetical protein